jgi:hypothetical protein
MSTKLAKTQEKYDLRMILRHAFSLAMRLEGQKMPDQKL